MFRRLPRAAGAALVLILVLGALPAWADISGLSATITGPDPNPVPGGSTATASAEFSLAADAGPITVGFELDAPSGFGELRLDPSGTSAGLTSCVESPTRVTCEWEGTTASSPQTLAVFVDVEASTPPGSGGALNAIASSPTEPELVYDATTVSATVPDGSTEFSGTVITEGGAPVPLACVFVISSPTFFFPTVADGSGDWSLTGLPDTYSYVIGVTPPFDEGSGPCVFTGTPPTPGPGELQPEWHDNIWIDFDDPALISATDPYAYAVSEGATVLSSTTTGIETCLTTDPGDVVPRPPCLVATTTTTSTTSTTSSTSTTTTSSTSSTSTTTSTTAAPSTTAQDVSAGEEVAGDDLPATGAELSLPLSVALSLFVAGLATVALARRSHD